MVTSTIFTVDTTSGIPIYRQLANWFNSHIQNGAFVAGEKLPPTRDLSKRFKLNRATIAAAYSVLEDSGLVQSHVGRGSFITRHAPAANVTDNNFHLPHRLTINFASSRPAADAFPLAQFRRLSKAVIDSAETTEILQLGSPHGYGPLRRYLLEREVAEGLAGIDDDLMVTNGCQQALDLLARSFASNGENILCEDPVYHGLLRVFSRAGARITAIPVGSSGCDLDAIESAVVHQKPRLLVITPSFQNPTGVTMPLESRIRLVELAQKFSLTLVENDIYSELRYIGEALPSLKQLDRSGKTILLRSYSKIAFPGLRVGWVTAPREVIARLTEEKQISDLHSDQLAQAIFLRFAESGELTEHIKRTREMGRERLEAAFSACEAYWPNGTSWTHPEGGMCFWIKLPSPLTAELLLRRAREEEVDFLPGSHFSLGRAHAHALRISFGGLSPSMITRGLRILGGIAYAELATQQGIRQFEPAAALV